MPATARLEDIEDESTAKHATLADIDETPPEVSKAIAAVPKPQLAYMQAERSLSSPLYQPPVPVSSEAKEHEADLAEMRRDIQARQRVPSWKQVAGMAADLATHPAVGSESTEAGLGAPVTKGLEELGTPGQRKTGALRLAAAGTEALTPAISGPLLEAPASLALPMAEGIVAGKGARFGAKKLGATPEQQDLIEDLGFWAPGVAHAMGLRVGLSRTPEGTTAAAGIPGKAGLGVAVTSEGTTARVKLGGFEREIPLTRNAPSAPAIAPPTIEGEHPATSMVKAQQAEAQAMRMASGLPPVSPTPPPPVPPLPPPVNEVGSADIAKIARMVRRVPGEFRAQTLLEAHETLTKLLTGQGKIVGPDGKIVVLDPGKPQQAEKLATDWLNQEIKRQQQQLANQGPKESERATAKPLAKAPAAAEKPVQAVKTPEPVVQTAHVSDIEETAKPAVPVPVEKVSGAAEPRGRAKGAPLPAAGAGQAEQLSGGVPGRRPEGRSEPERAPEVPKLLQPVAQTPEPAEAQQSTSQPLTEPKATPWKKGDRLVTKEGTEATVEYSSPNMRIIRARDDQGNKFTVSGRAVEELKEAPKFKFRSTQTNIPEDSEAAKALSRVRERISKADLMAQGTDVGGNHVTVRYGLKSDDTEGIERYLSSLEPFEATLGKTERFEPSEHSEGAAVINAPIEAPELHKINAELEKHGEFTEPSFKEYKPHATIAYVKPEAANRYVGMDVTHGKKFTVKSIAITDRNGNQKEVPLAGKKAHVSEIQRPKEEIDREIDELVARGEKRRAEAKDETAKGLHPTASDWMSEEELKRLGELQAERHPYTAAENDREAARRRVEEKRAARRTEAEETKQPSWKTSGYEVEPGLRKRAEEAGILKSGPGPEPGEVGTMKIADLHLAPRRFQYKLGTDTEGVGTLLKEVKRFNRNLANVVSVWRDPADGKFYVINGHHRFELAKRMGETKLDVRHITAQNERQARAIGALQNISEGRGTAVDAAKFFREAAMGPEDLEKEGISMGEATARKGLAMSRLDPAIYNRVIQGELREGRAVAIGEGTDNPAEQKAILELIDKREQRGRSITDGQLAELIRFVKESGKETETTANLFGTEEIEHSLALEKAELSDYAKQQLAKEKRLFGFVAGKGRAEELAKGGNIIQAERSKDISQAAAQAEEVYNRLSSRGGELAQILEENAKRLHVGDNPLTVRSEFYDRLRQTIRALVGGGQENRPAGSQGAPEGSREPHETPEATGEPKGSVGPLFSAEEQPAPIFYSKAQRVALEKVPRAAAGSAILSTLRNNGVKDEEIKWLGLDDFLQGKFRVEKKDLMRHIAENNLQLTEVAKRGRGTFQPTGEELGTKYEQYTLPGSKENYTELLLTLPISEADPQLLERTKAAWQTLVRLLRADDLGGFDTVNEAAQDAARAEGTPGNDYSPATVTAAREWKRLRLQVDVKKHQIFQSGHFTEPNILTHVRFDERTDSEGKKVLLVEEVQSDWHQHGKKLGYTGDAQKELEKHIEQLRTKEWEARQYWSEHPGDREAQLRTQRALADLQDAQQRYNRSNKGVPDAPFKADWHELAMKRMLRYAAENGYDRLAWTTGQQQAERYNLEKQVSRVTYRPDEKRLLAYTKRPSHWTNEGFEEDAAVDRKGVTPEELGELVGKELADRLLNRPTNVYRAHFAGDEGTGTLVHEISGADLRMGGEWAKALYDRAIPNFLNKVGKKWGAKVGETQIAGRHNEAGTRLVFEGPYAGVAVHSVDITPPMRRSVVYEGQSLFKNYPDNPIKDRSPEAWSRIISGMKVDVVDPGEGLKKLVRVNGNALQVLGRILGRSMGGVSLDPHWADYTAKLLHVSAGQMEPLDRFAAKQLEHLAKVLADNTDPDSGVTIVPDRPDRHPLLDLLVTHEEALHAELQHGLGKGDLRNSVPAEMAEHPLVKRMADRIREENGDPKLDPHSLVAEAFVDAAIGTHPELSQEEAAQLASDYYNKLVEKFGRGALEKAQSIQRYVDKRARSIIKPGQEKAYEDINRGGRDALQRALARGDEGRRREEAPPGGGGTEGGKLARGEAEAPPGTPSSRAAPTAVQPVNGETGRQHGAAEGGSTARGTLHSTQPVGLTDDELQSWAKSKNFRVEPAGEQTDLFGSGAQIFRVSRTRGGERETGLVYESQLDKLGIAKESKQASLFASESGGYQPGRVRDFLNETLKELRGARKVESGVFDLDSRHQARVLRAVQLIQATNEKYGGAKALLPDLEQVYHHLEDPDHVKLTARQNALLDDVVLPVMEQNDLLYEQLKKEQVPIENYVHRVVKGKGGWFDRIVSGIKGTGRGNLLSKSAPQTKGRTMMALEYVGPGRNEQRSLLHQPGERMVVSIKGGQVTAWINGKPENLGGISHTQEGKVFEDKDGSIWRLTQASTKEIERHTDLRYYHNALASAVVSNLQLAKALDAARFIDAFKASPDFGEIAVAEGQGQPPKGWRPTALPQLKGYYFEPHYADVFDRYAQRLQQTPSALDQVGAFMRVAMLLNPIMHPLNVAASWAVDRGATGFLPHTYMRAWRAGTKAIKAVATQNEDFLHALDEGAPLMSQREKTAKITELFFEQLGEGLRKEEPWAVRVAKGLGMTPVTLISLLHKFVSKVAWIANDVLFLQAAYERQTGGMSLKDALTETGRTIPEYRLAAAPLNSRTLGKIMESRWATIFGAYHYGLLKSFAEAGKSALGLHEEPIGGNQARDTAKGWDRLALLGLVALALYPLLDEVAKEVTGDSHARVKRFGPLALIDVWYGVLTQKKGIGEAVQTSVTPAPQTKAIAELAMNRQFYSGRQIYNPHDEWKTQGEQLYRYLLAELGQLGQAYQASASKSRWRRFAWGQAAVQFRPTRAEKIAQDIARSKVGTEAPESGKMENYEERHDIVDALRHGDRSLLDKALERRDITPKKAHELQQRARRPPLADMVHGFSYDEVKKVRDAAEKDGNPEQVAEMNRVLAWKRRNVWRRHETVPTTGD